ncbi:hypothetical protein ACIGGE_12300 [Qipengyuania sp. NPDC077410]|uniref:hypothetical protein n=1 Tax=Qipengyuania sp. NPDC077410 TaxID=3364496 RepID=UPI0037C921F9
MFFLAATPFELNQSGFVYLIKAIALGGIIVYATLIRDARASTFSPLIAIAFLLFLVTNLTAWSDRVAIALPLILFGAVLGQVRGTKWDRDFYSVVFLFIAVHVAALIFATLLYYTTSTVLDIHGLVFPEASRAMAIGDIGRLSGFHTEPGTYSQWTLAALLLLALIRGVLSTQWHAVVIGSVLMTLSLWGVLASGLFALAFLVEAVLVRDLSSKSRRLLIVASFALIGIGLSYLISPEIRQAAIDFLSLKASFSTQSGLDKLRAAHFLSENYTKALLLGLPIDPGFCPTCISPQDSGLALTGSFYLGFAFSGFLAAVIAVRLGTLWNWGFVFAILPLFVWKAHVYEPLLWIIVGYILAGPSRACTDPTRYAGRARRPRSRIAGHAQ